tara:strand:- start:450 stop:617 length:168 start_codon:yes stop_codon:yes gene_type:complete
MYNTNAIMLNKTLSTGKNFRTSIGCSAINTKSITANINAAITNKGKKKSNAVALV